MKYLMYSTYGEGAHILYRIKNEGNDCKLFIKDKYYREVFDGMLDKIELENIESFIDKNTLVIFDSCGNGEYADYLRKKDIKVYGSSIFSDKLELDRNYGIEVMKQCGIKVPKFEEFTDFNKAKEYIEYGKNHLVFKPNNAPTKLTYVAKTEHELIEYLIFIESKYKNEIKSFIIQEFLEGIPVSSEFFCDGENFLFPGNHTVEVKKFMNNDLGPSSGCSGNITWPCEDDYIIKSGIKKLELICRENQLIGQIDLNTIVNERGVYGLEFTARIGYDATPTLLTLVREDIGQFFYDIACGQEYDDIDIDNEYAGSIRVTVPPYPIDTKKMNLLEKVSPSKNLPIFGYEEYSENIYMYDVKLGDEKLVHASGSGVICLAIGTGNNPEESLILPNEIVENLVIPDKQYRTDLDVVLPGMVSEVELSYARK